jgi:hypothetical protein
VVAPLATYRTGRYFVSSAVLIREGGYVATNGPLHDGVIEAVKRALGDLSSP